MNVFDELIQSHWTYAKAVLWDEPAYRARGVLFPSAGVVTMLTTVGLTFPIILLFHASLPSSTPTVQILRLFSLPYLLALFAPIALDRSRFTLGGDFRDIAIPALAWLPIAEALKTCLVSIWDEDRQRAPRWIVPEAQAKKFKGATKVEEDEDVKQRIAEARNKGSGSAKSSRSHHHLGAPSRFTIPTTWYYIPHPPFWSSRRLLWAIDSLALRRPGTSWIFPHECRAMEWAHRPMLHSAAVYEEAERIEAKGDVDAAQRKREEAPVWFGQLEWGYKGCLAQLIFLYGVFRFVAWLNLETSKGPYDFYTFPLWQQYAMTFGLGSTIAFTFSPIEYLIGPLLLQVFRFPATATSPTFQRPLVSSGPTEFWGKRWHQWLRRDFSTIARMMPLSREFATMMGVWTFSVSAMEHNLVFSRFEPAPPTILHAVYLLFNPPIQFFFVSQALLILLERQLLGPASPTESIKTKTLRRFLLWFGLLTSGRWVTGHLTQLGVFDPTEFFNWNKVGTVWHDIQRERGMRRREL